MIPIPSQLDRHLIGWWDLSRGPTGTRVVNHARCGAALDAAVLNLDPGTDWTAGRCGWALGNFTAANYISWPVNLFEPYFVGTAHQGTIAALVELPTGMDGYLFAIEFAINIRVQGGTGKVFGYATGDVGDAAWSAAGIADDHWHLVALTWTPALQTIWIDGRIRATASPVALADLTAIAVTSALGYSCENMRMAWAGMWTRALAAGDVVMLDRVCRAATPWRRRVPGRAPAVTYCRSLRRRDRYRSGRVLGEAVSEGAVRGKYYSAMRGRYRVFNAAVYRFYRDDAAPPAEGDSPYATSATLPDEPADAFADGTWYLSVSYFNGVLDSGFLPLGPAGETCLRLDVSGGQQTGSPPAGPLDWRLEIRPAGVVRIHGVYCQSDADLRAGQWSIAYTTDGGDPPEDTPDAYVEMSCGALEVLQYDLPAQSNNTTVKVRLQTRRNDGSWVYSESSTIEAATAATESAAELLYAQKWTGRLPGG